MHLFIFVYLALLVIVYKIKVTECSLKLKVAIKISFWELLIMFWIMVGKPKIGDLINLAIVGRYVLTPDVLIRSVKQSLVSAVKSSLPSTHKTG